MKRISNFKPRTDFEKRNAEIGFDFGNLDGSGYWNETVGYQFTSGEIDRLEAATNELFGMTMELMDDLVQDREYMDQLGLSAEFQNYVKNSWDRNNFSIYGRFDFFFDGNEIKLYEYNADTPTSILESSLIQYYWMKDRGLPDQFNSIHEKLIESWKFIKENEIKDRTLYFSSVKSNEDYRTCEYLMDTASQAGCNVKFLFTNDIGTDGHEFYDLQPKRMESIFKLYPWEWMVMEKFGPVLPKAHCFWIEPPWKVLLSNKAMLVKLWEKFPNHELLLPTYNTPKSGFVRKPVFSREGANITLPNQPETPGDYSEDENFVYQMYKPLPWFDGWYPMVGSWIIGDEAAGIGIREDKNLVTGNMSRFTPHWFE